MRPPVPLITPEYVPLALLKVKLFEPNTTLPPPLKLTTLMPALEPLTSNVPAFDTALLAIEPVSVKIASLLIVVAPL